MYKQVLPMTMMGLLLFGFSSCIEADQPPPPYPFNVTITIQGACHVTATDLDFGNYSPYNPVDALGTSTLSVQCSHGTPYEVKLSTGNSGSYAARHMLQGTDILSYNLYTDYGRTNIWTDTYPGIMSGTGTGFAQLFTVYGKIPINQHVPEGNYSDTITVTVSY